MSVTPKTDVYELVAPYLHPNLDGCAPKFVWVVQKAIRTCNESCDLDVVVNEGLREPFVQSMYYTIGRDEDGHIVDKDRVVTYARSSLYSWHGFGLAVDVKSRSRGYFKGVEEEGARWFSRVAVIFKEFGLDWGGDWIRKDIPHFQWGTLKPAPSQRARDLYAQGGKERVWKEVGAV